MDQEITCDNGGRRKIAERRQFNYTFHIPERRRGSERRTGKDRRKKWRHWARGVYDLNS